jgi:hypothetical protein
MAVKRFFGKNKEIFMHGLFVEMQFPYLFFVQYFLAQDCAAGKLYGFGSRNYMVFLAF